VCVLGHLGAARRGCWGGVFCCRRPHRGKSRVLVMEAVIMKAVKMKAAILKVAIVKAAIMKAAITLVSSIYKSWTREPAGRGWWEPTRTDGPRERREVSVSRCRHGSPAGRWRTLPIAGFGRSLASLGRPRRVGRPHSLRPSSGWMGDGTPFDDDHQEGEPRTGMATRQRAGALRALAWRAWGMVVG
jgi:hypothetical protein